MIKVVVIPILVWAGLRQTAVKRGTKKSGAKRRHSWERNLGLSKMKHCKAYTTNSLSIICGFPFLHSQYRLSTKTIVHAFLLSKNGDRTLAVIFEKKECF